MPTNPYFDHTKFNRGSSEHNLVQNLVDETIKIHGLDCYYIPREFVDEDFLFGEDNLSQFTMAFLIEVYVESNDAWQGKGDFLGKFGLELNDEANLIVSRQRFLTEITDNLTNITNPREGDLIYVPTLDLICEIRFVEHDRPFFQLGQHYTYTMTVERFAYSYETLNTGVADIDQIGTDYANNDDASNSLNPDNTQIETEADGSATDGFDDSGTDDRGTGVINFDETDPFAGY